jgi:ATP-dependent DNA helicase RecG
MKKTTAYQVLKTICAFANDLYNLNGGYIVLGVTERDGKAVLPPQGLDLKDIESIQKWIRGYCNQIDPKYHPVLSPETVADKHILVIWAPASDARPHKAPDGDKAERKYWVRLESETIDAEKSGVLGQLQELTARVPFDSRRALQARLEDLRETKVREFLRDICSKLLDESSAEEIYRRMRISAKVNGYEVPLNVGLLFFSDNPEKWFAGARIEVVQFTADAFGNVQEERIFRGPIHTQIRDCLTYLENLSSFHLEKQDSNIRTHGWVSYPLPALREALVNAVYHRGYDQSVVEPTKVYLYPDRMEIINYPGPVAGIQLSHLQKNAWVPPVPARNRRIGEFLKELRLAESRGTGLPKIFSAMDQNGSPEPRFDFDEARSYFRVVLPAHPEYLAIATLRDAAHLRAIGNGKAAFQRLETTWKAHPESALLTEELIRYYSEGNNSDQAESVFTTFQEKIRTPFPHIINTMIDMYTNSGQESKAQKLLRELPPLLSSTDAIDTAILARRLKLQQDAHRYFERAGEAVLADARALHEFAQTKIDIAQQIWHNQGKNRYPKEENKRLLKEAMQLLERVIQMDAPPTRRAWVWRDLGRIRDWLKSPKHDVMDAYQHAIELIPDEGRFQEERDNLSKKSNQ